MRDQHIDKNIDRGEQANRGEVGTLAKRGFVGHWFSLHSIEGGHPNKPLSELYGRLEGLRTAVARAPTLRPYVRQTATADFLALSATWFGGVAA